MTVMMIMLWMMLLMMMSVLRLLFYDSDRSSLWCGMGNRWKSFM